MCDTKMVVIHQWEDKGHGKAPFSFVSMISMPSAEAYGSNVEGYNNAMADAWRSAKQFDVRLGSCDVCGTGIHNHCVIRDANGKHFVVGCDCVEKTDDSKLITATKNANRLRVKAAKAEKAAKQREQQRLNSLAVLESERAANGGLTNSELAEKKFQADSQSQREKFSLENKWILDVLKQCYQGDFVVSMIENLERRSLWELSDRGIRILCEIYGKHFGRSGSKKYLAAEEEFWTHCPENVEAM